MTVSDEDVTVNYGGGIYMYVYWNDAPPPRISADVIQGKNMKEGNEKKG
jgi:hypothetical protein